MRGTESLRVLVSAILLASVVFACGEGDSPVRQRNAPGQSAPATSADLTVALTSAPPAVDPFLGPQPFQLDIRPYLFPYLVRLESNGYELPTIDRDLAVLWDWDTDGRRLTVTLDATRRWSNGRFITADDVVRTFRLYMERGWIPHRRTTGFRGGWQSAISEFPRRDSSFQAGKHLLYRVDLADSSQVRFFFQSDVPLWSALEMLAVPIVSREEIERITGKFEPTPGTPPPPIPSAGKFRYRPPNSPEGDGLLLPNRASQPEPHARLQSVTLQSCPGPEARILRVRRQVADLTLDVPIFRLPSVLSEDDDVRLHDAGIASVEMLCWNVQRYDLGDELREAVSLALDRERMLSLLTYGGQVYGGVARAFLSPASSDFELPVHNPAAAAEILQTTLDAPVEVGASYGFELLYDQNNGLRASLATFIEEDLARIGVAVTLVPLDGPELFRRHGNGDFEVALLGFRPPPTPDASSLWASWGAWNGGRYYSPQVDSLFRVQFDVEDSGEVARLARLLERNVLTDRPFSYLVYRHRLDLVHPRVQDYNGSVRLPFGDLARTWVQTSGGTSR